MILHAAEMKTPIGKLLLFAKGDALVALALDDGEAGTRRWLTRRFGRFEEEPHRDPAGAVTELRAYFKGDLAALDRVRVDCGGTPFQRSVWAALRRIPSGRTISYGELARRVGRPLAFRAVGAANGSNPVALIVPCHRVIAADGTIGGYGGGLPCKRWLLAHEGALPEPESARTRPRRVRNPGRTTRSPRSQASLW